MKLILLTSLLLLTGCTLDTNGYYTKKRGVEPRYCEVETSPGYFVWMMCRDNDKWRGNA